MLITDIKSAALGALMGAVCLVLSGAANQISPGDVGAGQSVVASCDDSVEVSWADGASSPSYNGSATVAQSDFEVSSLRLLNLDGSCDGQTWDLTIVDPGNTALVTQSGTLSVVAGAATISFSPTKAKAIERTAIAIHG